MFLVIGIIVIALLVLYILGGVIFVHRLVVKKYMIILLAVGVGLVIYGQPQNDNALATVLPVYQINAPELSDAPYLIQTPSRMYYVVQYSDDGQIVLLMEYYEYNDNEWQHNNRMLTLDRLYYGTVKITHR